jgi:DNA-directed RNA polymerase specialized sigma24 family protein
LLGNDLDAEDATQEAIPKVLGNVDRYDGSRDALSWMFAITTFEARTVLERRSRRREASSPVAEIAGTGSTPEADVAEAEPRQSITTVGQP